MSMQQETVPTIYLSDKTYNTIKPIVTIILPAISSLYFGLAAVWGLPAAEQVVGTIALFTTFLGVVLGLSSKRYNKAQGAIPTTGQIVVTEDIDGKKKFSLELDAHPDDIANLNEVKFQVTKPS